MPEWVSQVTSIVVALSALGVALLGFFGLQQWKRELKGKSKFDIARHLAILAFEFKDLFHYTRDIRTYSVESVDRRRDEKESPGEANILDEWRARGRRMDALRENVKKMHEARWEASILLDEEVPQFVKPLEDAFGRLSVDFNAYFDSEYGARHSSFDNRDVNWVKELHSHVYGLPNDEICKNVDSAVDTLVEKLKSYIR